MTHRHSAAPLLAALLLLPASAHPAQPSASGAEQGWAAIGACASIANERARHACLDDVLRRAGLLTPEAEANERRRQFGSPASSSAPAPAPAPAAPSRTEAVAEPDRLEVRLASAVLGADRKIVLTTNDGAVWKQTDSDTVPRLPAAGDVVRIRKASLGSYLCTLPTNHTFRCLRTQ